MEVKLDIIAIIISVIAILASVICAVIAFIQNYKINKINMKAGYYNKIFDSYLIEKIPMSYRYLIFKDNKLSDSDKISDVLSDLLKDILYFKCADRKFYEVLKKSIEEIEDYFRMWKQTIYTRWTGKSIWEYSRETRKSVCNNKQ